jgi:hypothetical protein
VAPKATLQLSNVAKIWSTDHINLPGSATHLQGSHNGKVKACVREHFGMRDKAAFLLTLPLRQG